MIFGFADKFVIYTREPLHLVGYHGDVFLFQIICLMLQRLFK